MTGGAGVRRRARELLSDHGLNSVPVDVEHIIRARGLQIVEVPSIRPGVFGAFYLDGAEAGIMVSHECYTPGHRRFTLAHELGHFVLDGHAEELLPAGATLAVSLGGDFRDQRSRVEREADTFAAELLMPRASVVAIARDGSLMAVKGIARVCEVSLSSAAIRMSDLVDEPVAIILSFDGAIQWYATSPPLRGHGWARGSLKGEWCPPRSATRRLMESNEREHRDAESVTQSLLLCEWFPGAPSMLRVDEECVVLGRSGRILTVLRPIELPPVEALDEERQREADRRDQDDWRSAMRAWEWD